MMVFMVRVPTHYNDGSPIPAEVAREITTLAYQKFGGYSYGPVEEGAWLSDDGQLFVEPSRQLVVSMHRSRLVEAREFAIEIGRKLGQQAMYTETRYSDGVEIIPIS